MFQNTIIHIEMDFDTMETEDEINQFNSLLDSLKSKLLMLIQIIYINVRLKITFLLSILS